MVWLPNTNWISLTCINPLKTEQVKTRADQAFPVLTIATLTPEIEQNLDLGKNWLRKQLN